VTGRVERWITTAQVGQALQPKPKTRLDGSHGGGQHHSYQRLRDELVAKGLLVPRPESPNEAEFTANVPFPSSSAAASVVLGRNASGPLEWKQQATKTTLKEWGDDKEGRSSMGEVPWSELPNEKRQELIKAALTFPDDSDDDITYCVDLPSLKAYASASGNAISGGPASQYGLEQISNISRLGGYRERFPPLVDRVPPAFFG
jgi:hypothetical protein